MLLGSLQGTPGADAKSDLNMFLQRFLQRPVTKTDIIYTTTKFGHQFQAIVKMNCLGGQEYAGVLSGDPKNAEKNAALQALQANASTIASLPPAKSDPSKKRKPMVQLTPAELAIKRAKAADGEVDNPSITPKTKLNNICMKITKRYLQKGETVYEARKVAGGFQATVKLTCLPGDWATRLWAGQVSSLKAKAEQSAAEIALDQIEKDPELAAEAAKPGKGKGKGKGGCDGGKGKGKGWVGGYDDWSWMMPPPWMMWGPPGFGGPSGADLPRERIQEEKVSGEIVEWKDKYGWAKPTKPIEHPAFKGKIYLNKKDLVGAETLEAGQMVKFFVYEDPSGLGGEEITVG